MTTNNKFVNIINKSKSLYYNLRAVFISDMDTACVLNCLDLSIKK